MKRPSFLSGATPTLLERWFLMYDQNLLLPAWWAFSSSVKTVEVFPVASMDLSLDGIMQERHLLSQLCRSCFLHLAVFSAPPVDELVYTWCGPWSTGLSPGCVMWEELLDR